MENKRMKKVLSLCLLSTMITGCSGQSAVMNHSEEKDPTAAVSHEPPQIPDRDLIIQTIQSYNCLDIEFNSDVERKNGSEMVIYGEVDNYSFEAVEGLIFTVREVRILETLAGSAEAGEIVRVRDMGGVCLLKDFISSVDNRDRLNFLNGNVFKGFTDEEMNTRYIEYTPTGYFYPQVGDRSVLFLTPTSSGDNEYWITDGWFGEYKEIRDNTFCSTPGPLEGNREYTYDELKEKLEV